MTRLAVRLLPIPLALTALAGCGSSTPSSQPATAPQSPAAQPVAAEPASGPVGSSFTDGPLTVTVDSVKLTPTLISPDPNAAMQTATNGQWATIHAVETNTGGVPVQPGQLFVKTADGTSWDGYALGDMYGQELPRTEVAAGDRVAGVVLVDMPPGRGTVVYQNAARQVVYRWPFNG